jgi:asparagine synthase (glutamine-hydrolysing)
MCGICGKVSRRGVESGEIQNMLAPLAHRGPDGQALKIIGQAGLGHRRLSIIDLANGTQPLANEDETVWVTFNGEIYNYQELRKELLERGHRFRTHSDTEIIVHLYEEQGVDCVKRLRGMFAFALWDQKRRRLFAARDHLGQKPFYYSLRGQNFLFGSEIKALLAADPQLQEMNPEALDQYLTLRLIAPPLSMFRSIHKLPPAHRLTFSFERGIEVERYWDLNYEPKWSGSDDDLVDELEQHLIESLKLHMVSDVPVGAFMSGGLDSTLVVAMVMKHVAATRIKTFSLGLPYQDFDEAPYARLVADRYGTEHYEQIVQPSLLDTLPDLVWHLDEPSDPLSICTYLISTMARRHVKVVLGGDGGDELFGGYDRYYGNRYADYYALAPEWVRKYAIGPLLQLVPDGKWYKSRGHRMKWLHRMSFLSGGDRYAGSLSYFYFEPGLKESLYGPAMQSLSFDPEKAIRAPFESALAHDSVDRMLYADCQVRLPDHPVMILDRMTMAHGLEARAPFMDHRVAEFAARLPARMKVRGRTLRYIQTRLAERYLPQALLTRPKQGFSSALPYMLGQEYRLLFDIFLRNSHLAGAGYFRQPFVDQMLTEHLAGSADHANRLWLLLNSEVWYRMFEAGQTAEALHDLINQATPGRVRPELRQAV